ncbi:hypothetical protein D3C72_722720 [compost metagenome]
MADDDQKIEIGQVSIVGFVDPVVAGVGSEQDDLQHPSVAPPGLGAPAPAVDRSIELGQQGRADTLQLALLLGRQMVEVSAHGAARPANPATSDRSCLPGSFASAPQITSAKAYPAFPPSATMREWCPPGC